MTKRRPVSDRSRTAVSSSARACHRPHSRSVHRRSCMIRWTAAQGLLHPGSRFRSKHRGDSAPRRTTPSGSFVHSGDLVSSPGPWRPRTSGVARRVVMSATRTRSVNRRASMIPLSSPIVNKMISIKLDQLADLLAERVASRLGSRGGDEKAVVKGLGAADCGGRSEGAGRVAPHCSSAYRRGCPASGARERPDDGASRRAAELHRPPQADYEVVDAVQRPAHAVGEGWREVQS